ncbi:ankyrin repeat and BTB/POZ domain-containing protein 2 [Eurytemora carolleeae]|uniref:ankyrin repeat and BTB/POZ domain-containing protein 2 n=1 Tax=Eurytemora carolleeae TaxID=1294199 RepID=UPI000C756D18|nr:ankyrin repeat and BTB/POZ domain-containing protein 2 [Eurytemora carolleeae]|eukprot:XP_023349205.1 ankyrin repeat and BTB/POZ domain-containing protein 2-like [Eurytemora affinis]
MSRPGSSVMGLHIPDQYTSSLNSTSTSGYSSHYSGQYSGQTSPYRQYSPMHYGSTQYITVPCSVKSTPVCQADVSHEIVRPTPRRAGVPSSSGSPRLSRGSPGAPSPGVTATSPVRALNRPACNSMNGPFPLHSSTSTPSLSSNGSQLTIPVNGRSSESPSRPLATHTPVRGPANHTPVRGDTDLRKSLSPTKDFSEQSEKLRGVSPGSPYWCGVGSRDPMSRQYEYPERDVPSAGPGNRLITNEDKFLHVTNLLIDKSGNSSLYDDSGTEEHPSVRQGRSSLVKYKANNKTKPKRKFLNHLNHGGREKGKRHEHTKQDVNRLPAKGRMGKLTNGEFAKGLEKANQLLEVKAALEQLSFGNISSSHGGINSSSSTFSSMSEYESEPDSSDMHEVQERNRKCRASSQETLSTTVTSADEFVWIDSHNRLVEVQQVPWTAEDIHKVLQTGAVKDSAHTFSNELYPRLSYYIQRALVRISREAQRLSQRIYKCSKFEILAALKVVLPPVLANSCTKACLRAGTMYTISSDFSKQTKSSRAGLKLDVGKFQQWMGSVRVGKFIQEYAAVYMTAGIENIMEEVLQQCLQTGAQVTVSVLEECIGSSSELWGLFQPYAHLSSCRTSKGSLEVPRCMSLSVSDTIRLSSGVKTTDKSLSQILLTTCVGSKDELESLISPVAQFYHKYYHSLLSSTSSRGPPTWTKDSLHTLYHFMRCSQLENQNLDPYSSIQELVYERPYMVLPPLIEWFRVAVVFSISRLSFSVDSDDVFQAARVLLPGADYPPLGQAFNQQFQSLPSSALEEIEFINSTKRNTAFQLLLSGRRELATHALTLLPTNTKLNTANDQGLTPLMVACLREDFVAVKLLIDLGAIIDFRVSASEKWHTQVHPELTHWTALHFATMTGSYDVTRLLLEKGGNVEGNVDVEDDICTETPLQLAAAAGRVDLVELLLSFGASPFLTTIKVDSMAFGSSAQKGSYSALSTAATHGQRKCLHKLITHPSTLTSQNSGKDVLSLEEILAEGVSNGEERTRPDHKKTQKGNLYSRLTKGNVKRLQEAMYHSTEAGNIHITLDLRNFGVPWSVHSWIRTLITAHHAGLTSVADELLQDFCKEWTEECSSYFIDECLPVLFSLFRTSRTEGSTLLLADLLSACYSREKIDRIEYTEPVSGEMNAGSRIDPKFVNNPDLSDIQFRVEGQLFYAHKLVLITSSYKFRTMLNSKFCEGNPPILQINDIRFEIFEMVMKYLYQGSAVSLSVEQGDILELMAAANFFQLEGLLHYCEVECSKLIDLDTIVSYYIHAKVYSAANLLVYAEGFLLQNLVALLTYDDSVKRLIFGKKLQNHDVLSGLLRTLQDRMKKRGQNKSKKLSL